MSLPCQPPRRRLTDFTAALVATGAVDGQHFFIKARVALLIRESDQVFAWIVWVSLSEPNFPGTSEHWNTPGRENDPAAFGWFSTHLPLYEPTTVSMKTLVQTQRVGVRPWWS